MPPKPITESRAPVRPSVRYCISSFPPGRYGNRPIGRDRPADDVTGAAEVPYWIEGRASHRRAGGGGLVEERTGEAFELGEQLTVVGRRLGVGEAAPEFALEHFDGSAMATVRLADSAGSVRLLNVVNSLDTPVCHVETRRWEALRHDLPAGVRVYTVSMDL